MDRLFLIGVCSLLITRTGCFQDQWCYSTRCPNLTVNCKNPEYVVALTGIEYGFKKNTSDAYLKCQDPYCKFSFGDKLEPYSEAQLTVAYTDCQVREQCCITNERKRVNSYSKFTRIIYECLEKAMILTEVDREVESTVVSLLYDGRRDDHNKLSNVECTVTSDDSIRIIIQQLIMGAQQQETRYTGSMQYVDSCQGRLLVQSASMTIFCANDTNIFYTDLDSHKAPIKVTIRDMQAQEMIWITFENRSKVLMKCENMTMTEDRKEDREEENREEENREEDGAEDREQATVDLTYVGVGVGVGVAVLVIVVVIVGVVCFIKRRKIKETPAVNDNTLTNVSRTTYDTGYVDVDLDANTPINVSRTTCDAGYVDVNLNAGASKDLGKDSKKEVHAKNDRNVGDLYSVPLLKEHRKTGQTETDPSGRQEQQVYRVYEYNHLGDHQGNTSTVDVNNYDHIGQIQKETSDINDACVNKGQGHSQEGNSVENDDNDHLKN